MLRKWIWQQERERERELRLVIRRYLFVFGFETHVYFVRIFACIQLFVMLETVAGHSEYNGMTVSWQCVHCFNHIRIVERCTILRFVIGDNEQARHIALQFTTVGQMVEIVCFAELTNCFCRKAFESSIFSVIFRSILTWFDTCSIHTDRLQIIEYSLVLDRRPHILEIKTIELVSKESRKMFSFRNFVLLSVESHSRTMSIAQQIAKPKSIEDSIPKTFFSVFTAFWLGVDCDR